MDYFKVVTEDLKSVGLLGASQIQYKIGEWVYPTEPLSSHPRKGGGLWVLKSKSDAFKLQKYLERKHGKRSRVFRCGIGVIIYQTSYRVKTDKVILLEEIKKVARQPLFY